MHTMLHQVDSLPRVARSLASKASVAQLSNLCLCTPLSATPTEPKPHPPLDQSDPHPISEPHERPSGAASASASPAKKVLRTSPVRPAATPASLAEVEHSSSTNPAPAASPSKQPSAEASVPAAVASSGGTGEMWMFCRCPAISEHAEQLLAKAEKKAAEAFDGLRSAFEADAKFAGDLCSSAHDVPGLPPNLGPL